MLIQACVILSWLTVVANAATAAPVIFPISNRLCPVLPEPEAGNRICSPFTFNYCDSPTASCPFCAPSDGLSLFDNHVNEPQDYVVDVEDYLFYHMLNAEYLVEFAKNPMPFQTALNLPHCGINPNPAQKRETTGDSLERRKWPKIGGTLGQIGEGIKHAGKEIGKGLAAIPMPRLAKAPTPPTFPPRPICLPRTLEIPVHFTVFTTNFTTSRLVTEASLLGQLNLTNEAFKPLGISFFMSSLSYHIGREWERFTHNKNGGPPDYFAYAQRIKSENRYGGNDEVSIWVVESIDEVDCQTGFRVQGYCSQGRDLNTAGHSVDGCAITIDSLPGIDWRGDPGDGSALTHEIGHWLDLDHIFPNGKNSGCTGESDNIQDTFQFPNNPDMFNQKQQRCCATEVKGKVTWDFCNDGKEYDVTNYMSYSRVKGQIIAGNDPGSMPWTTEQRAHMFASYFTHRRPPSGKFKLECNDFPVFFDEPAAAAKERMRSLQRRSLGGFALRGPQLLKPGRKLLDQLIKTCSTPPDQNLVEAININTGETVSCDIEGNCQPPSTGPSCPDGSSPPCAIDQWCTDGSEPPCDSVVMCPNGSAPPCTDNGGSTCPDGQTSVCSTKTPGGENNPQNPTNGNDPNTPGNGQDPVKPVQGACPAGCKVHDNKCDKTTAPTCIFPDPRVSDPRGACACRPGYKASAYQDTDTTKQWRLPIPGQEHRVWVAEGVACDKLCTVSTGVGSCREISEVAVECAGYTGNDL